MTAAALDRPPCCADHGNWHPAEEHVECDSCHQPMPPVLTHFLYLPPSHVCAACRPRVRARIEIAMRAAARLVPDARFLRGNQPARRVAEDLSLNNNQHTQEDRR